MSNRFVCVRSCVRKMARCSNLFQGVSQQLPKPKKSIKTRLFNKQYASFERVKTYGTGLSNPRIAGSNPARGANKKYRYLLMDFFKAGGLRLRGSGECATNFPVPYQGTHSTRKSR